MTIRPIANPVRLALEQINLALEQAALAIDAHERGEDETPPWQRCRQHLQEVHGALVMLEIQGAVALCEESLALIDALEAGTAVPREQGLDLLMYGLLLLPRYLDRVSGQRRELPDTLLPVLNTLRGLRRTVPLPDYHFAAFDRVDSTLSCVGNPGNGQGSWDETLPRLRLMLQIGLLGLFRDPSSQRHARLAQRALERLAATLGDTLCGRWLYLAERALAPLTSGERPLSVSVKLLLSRIDLYLRALIRDPGSARNRLPPEAVRRGILYYTALGSESDPQLRRLREQLGLKLGMAPPALIEHEREALHAPESSVFKAASQAVREELERLQDTIETLSRLDVAGSDERRELSAHLARLSSTLSVLGLSDAAALLKRERTRLQSLDDTAGAGRWTEALEHTAVVLTQVDAQVRLLGQTVRPGNITPPPPQLRDAEHQALDECLKNLARVRAALEFFNGDLDEGEELAAMDTPMREAAGTLQVLREPRAAKLLEACARHILALGATGGDQSEQLDALADALAGLQWYLEGRQAGDDDQRPLDLAEQALQALEVGSAQS